MTTEALLVMDVQAGIVDRVRDQAEHLLETLARTVAAARGHGRPVLFVRVALRPGAPEVSPRNKSFSALRSSPFATDGDASSQIHPMLSPRHDDVVITKRRVSAFAGSDLDVVLRALDVDALVLTGIATSGVVLSTLRQAADLDFRITVLRDGCADADPEVHRVLMDKVFPRQASVISAGEWITSLGDT